MSVKSLRVGLMKASQTEDLKRVLGSVEGEVCWMDLLEMDREEWNGMGLVVWVWEYVKEII